MASRTETVLEDFLKHLNATFPGFSDETDRHQFELARMAWIGLTKANQHSHEKDAMFFPYQALDRAFGQSKFSDLNTRLGFFKKSAGWSRDMKITRAYWFSAALRVSIKEYLATSPWLHMTRLLMADGRALKTVPPAVASKDGAGVTTTAWVSAKKLNLVKVDLDGLMKLRAELLTACAAVHLDDAAATATSNPALGRAERAIQTIEKVSRLAMTDAAGKHHVAHQYQEAQSGRLYPLGISLASAQSLVKDAALAGLWEYDVANCHYAILAQMAFKSGYDCLAIRGYLADKAGVRAAIAAQAEIAPHQAKTCLVALMYGARASTWHENAIPREIGADAAKRLYLSPLFICLKDDVSMARAAILSTWPTTPKGWVRNDFGKSIVGTAKPEQKLAHLLQGVEAKALQAVINQHPDDIVLVQHDGFVSMIKLDVAAVSDAIYTATGYHLKLEEERLQADAYTYFEARSEHVRSKTP